MQKRSLLEKMPINNWNFFRSVSACNDQKSWLSENPQVYNDDDDDESSLIGIKVMGMLVMVLITMLMVMVMVVMMRDCYDQKSWLSENPQVDNDDDDDDGD